MRCRDARLALLERSLGGGRPDRFSGLSDHLKRCAACAEQARVDELLLGDLHSLRGEIPWTIDVRPTVMARLQAIGRVDRDEISVAQLGWSAAFAAAWVLALLAGLGWLLPESAPLIGEIAELSRALGNAVATFGAALVELVILPFKLAGILMKPLAALGTLLRQLEPLGVAAVAASYAAMAATIFLVVGRDLRRALPALANDGERGS